MAEHGRCYLPATPAWQHGQGQQARHATSRHITPRHAAPRRALQVRLLKEDASELQRGLAAGQAAEAEAARGRRELDAARAESERCREALQSAEREAEAARRRGERHKRECERLEKRVGSRLRCCRCCAPAGPAAGGAVQRGAGAAGTACALDLGEGRVRGGGWPWEAEAWRLGALRVLCWGLGLGGSAPPALLSRPSRKAGGCPEPSPPHVAAPAPQMASVQNMNSSLVTTLTRGKAAAAPGGQGPDLVMVGGRGPGTHAPGGPCPTRWALGPATARRRCHHM
jgi:hypothetical protein